MRGHKKNSVKLIGKWKDPEVTIVIPTYKTKNTIFRLLKYLALQSYKKFNVLIIYKPWEGYRAMLDKIGKYKDLSMADSNCNLFLIN